MKSIEKYLAPNQSIINHFSFILDFLKAGFRFLPVGWSAASQSPYPHYSLFYDQFLIDPILVTFVEICNFGDPNLVTLYFYEMTHFLD